MLKIISKNNMEFKYFWYFYYSFYFWEENKPEDFQHDRRSQSDDNSQTAFLIQLSRLVFVHIIEHNEQLNPHKCYQKNINFQAILQYFLIFFLTSKNGVLSKNSRSVNVAKTRDNILEYIAMFSEGSTPSGIALISVSSNLSL